MIREDLYYGSGNSSNRTMVYTYDKAGNILSKKKYAYINPTSSVSGSYTNYSYGYASTWKDRLTSYNGKSLTYDEIGNPLTYGTYRYQWAYGRQLSQIENGSDIVATFNYNDEGIRTVKTAQNSAGQDIRHEYDVVGGQINREVIRSSSSATSAVMKDIRYYYDASGRPVAIRAFTRTSSTANFTDTIYYLQTNLQGDVVGIYNASGTKIYEYAYDAWGNIIKSSQVAAGGSDAHAVNPFRYRGYYFDAETNLYYLQSRYYNPEWGRFLNADVYVNANGDLMGYNMYAYCSNNPVMGYDPLGEWDWGIFADLTVTVVALAAGFLKTTQSGLGAGIATFGKINNTVNAIYYEFSDGESDLTDSSYNDSYISRWDRIDYTKQEVQEEHYNLNAWRYNSEYSVHMYGWFLTGWANEKNIPVISNIADRFEHADVERNRWDERWYVNLATVATGLLGG